MEKGTIVKIISDRHFGFIKISEDEKNVFFHSSSCVDVEFKSLQEGDHLEFEIEEGERGPKATNIKKIS